MTDTTDKDREEARRVRCNHCMSEFYEEYIDVDALGPDTGETCPVCLKGDALMDISDDDHDARIRAEARGELCTNCEKRIRAEERQRAAEKICAIHCGSNENQTPTRWDGKCLYFDTCTYVSTILADDKEKV